MKRKRRSGGFTLLEMLMVVAIIAILIAIAFPVMLGALDRAREAVCIANRRALLARLAAEYMLDDREFTEGANLALTPEEAEEFVCPSGGVITYDFLDGDFTMHCSIHNGESAGKKTASALGGSFDALKHYYVEETLWPSLTGKNLDSASAHVSGTKANAFYNSLTRAQQEFLDGYTWRVTMNALQPGESDPGGNDPNRVRIFFTTNEMFDSVNKGQTVPVCYKYNPATGLYQYSLSTTKSTNSSGQAVLTGNSSVWGALDENGNFVSGGWMDTLPDDLSNPTGK